MSTAKKRPQSVDTSLDPALQYLNQRAVEVAITPTENSTKNVVVEEVTQIITNVFQVNAPGGANGQLQFNQDGKYVGDAELQYNPNSDTLTTGKVIANSITITGNASSFKLNGGYNNEVLKTDGNGNLSWSNVFPSVSGKTGKFLVTNGVSIDWSTSNYNSFATTTYVDSAIAGLVGTAPAMLDTLAEIANVIGQTNDPQYGIISQLANKANISSLAQVAFSGSYTDLSNRPNISTVGTSGNYSDLTNKPTIPATITDLGISDGTNGQVLKTDGNGTFTFTTVSGGGGSSYDQDLNTTNNVTFNSVVTGNISSSNGVQIYTPANSGNSIDIYTDWGSGNGGVEVWLKHDDGVEINTKDGDYSWKFANTGALNFPLTPNVTSAIVVNDNDNEFSISTDRGNISIWPESGKWLFGADGKLTVPGPVTSDDNLTLNSLGANSGYVAAVVADGDAGRVLVRTDNGTTTKSWEFDINGNLKLPAGGDIVNSSGQSVLGGGGASTGNITFTGDNIGSSNDIVNIVGNNYAQLESNENYIWVEETYAEIQVDGYGWVFHDDAVLTLANGANISQTTDDGGQKTFNITPSGTSDFEVITSDGGNIRLQTENTDNNPAVTNTWTFDKDGNITLPTNTSKINYANGTSILDGLSSGGETIPSYKGFRAHYGTMYSNTDDENGPINKLVIYKDTVSPTSAIDTDTSSDDFQVTGLTGSDVVAMLVVIGDGTDWETQTPTATLKTFVESIIDNVILDEGVEGDVNTVSAMKSAFYANFSNFSTIIPNPKVDLEFFDVNNQFSISPQYTTGDGASFSGISYNMDNDTLDLGSWGQGSPNTHEVNDVHVIPGNTIQDANGSFLQTPANDVTVTITGVADGAILSYTVTGTLPRPSEIWPSNSINDGGDDEYDGGNAIHTNLETEISYNDGNVVTGASAFGGGDYVVTYQAGIFGVFATGADINIIGTSGNDGGYGNDNSSSGFDGDGVAVTGSLYGDSAPAVTISEITNTDGTNNYSVSVATNGVISMTTSRGGLEFGALPEPGGPTHFHIMRPAGQEGSSDLYFGDDYNYVKLPGSYGAGTLGVEIGAKDAGDGGDQHVWRFGTDGALTLPGAVVKSTVDKTGSGDPAYPTAIDLTKSINKLSEGLYTLADGVEGQIMYLVPTENAVGYGNAGNVVINIPGKSRVSGRYTGQQYISIGGNFNTFYPFRTLATPTVLGDSDVYVDTNMCTLIYTDDAWQAQGGSWAV